MTTEQRERIIQIASGSVHCSYRRPVCSGGAPSSDSRLRRFRCQQFIKSHAEEFTPEEIMEAFL